MDSESAVCNEDSTDQDNVKNQTYESIQLNDSRKNDDVDTSAKSLENSSTNDEEKYESKSNEAQFSMDGELIESDTCFSENLSSQKSIGNKNPGTETTEDLQSRPKKNDIESDLRNKLNNFLDWSKKHLINLSPKVGLLFVLFSFGQILQFQFLSIPILVFTLLIKPFSYCLYFISFIYYLRFICFVNFHYFSLTLFHCFILLYKRIKNIVALFFFFFLLQFLEKCAQMQFYFKGPPSRF